MDRSAIESQLLGIRQLVDALRKKQAAIPKRPLQPGQSATISPFKPVVKQRAEIAKYINNFADNQKEIGRLKYKSRYANDPETQEQINALEKENDPNTHGYHHFIQHIVPVIKSRCSEFLPTLLNHGFLYRGTNPEENKGRLAFRAHSRENRRPTTSNYEANVIFNDAMGKLGLEARRDNSVFCISAEEMALGFGSTFILFPCNGSHYTWSEAIQDLVIYSSDLYRNAGDLSIQEDLEDRFKSIQFKVEKKANKPSDESSDRDLKYFYVRLLNELSYISVMSGYLGEITGIVANAKSRYKIVDTNLLNEITEFIFDVKKFRNQVENDSEFEIDLKRFQNYYKFHGDEDLDLAITSKNEIIFSGEYICVAAGLKEALMDALNENKDITEATLPKVPKLAPGVSKELPSFSKFGKISHDLAMIRADLQYLRDFPGDNDDKKRFQRQVSKEKKLSKSTSLNNASKILDYINTHCSKYVKDMQSTGHLLYRGIKMDESQNRLTFIGNSRINRKPKDSNKQASNEFNKLLTKMGIEANRSNSIFTTSDSSRTGSFGTRYIIFPFDSAKFSWTIEADIVLNSHSGYIWSEYTSGKEEFDDKFIDTLKNKFLPRLEVERKEYMSQFSQSYTDPNYDYNIGVILSNSQYTLEYLSKMNMNTLKDIPKNVSELPDGYQTKPELKTVMELNQFLLENLHKIKRKIDLEKFKDRYEPKNTDFNKALESRNEICVSGYYLALRETEFRKFIKTRLLGKEDLNGPFKSSWKI